MIQRSIGSLSVSAIGLGGMPMSIEGRPDEQRSVATIHAALDAGVTLIDTADAYHLHAGRGGSQRGADRQGAAELRRRHQRGPGGDQGWPPASRRRHLDPGRTPRAPEGGGQGFGEAARRRGDRALPVPPSRSQGALRRVGRRDPGPARRGRHPAGRYLQRQRASRSTRPRRCSAAGWYRYRTSSPRLTVRASSSWSTARSSGIAFLPWSPLGGIRNAAALGSRHGAFATIAAAHGVSPQQVTLAWELRARPDRDPDPRRLAAGEHPGLGAGRRSCPYRRRDRPALAGRLTQEKHA